MLSGGKLIKKYVDIYIYIKPVHVSLYYMTPKQLYMKILDLYFM